MSKASLELGGGNWAAKDGNLLGYAVGDTSGKYLPREFTFSRGADIAATRVNKDGLIEKYRENLLTYSNQFDSWTVVDATATSGQTGYDGTSDAWLFTTTVAGASLEKSITASGVVVFSMYAKKGTVDGIRLRIDAATDADAYFNLSNNSVHSFTGSAIDASITDLGGGWQRCKVYANISSPVKVAVYTTDGTTAYDNGNIYIQDAQFEYGLVATDYLESDDETGKAGVLDNLPRIDYTSGSAQLLMEPSRTNLIEQSEYFGDWSEDGTATVTLNQTTSPEGLTNAALLDYGASAGGPDRVSTTATITGSTVYAFSVFAKKKDASKIQLRNFHNSSYNAEAVFDLDAEAVAHLSAGADSGTIEDYGNGWYRCTLIFTSSSVDTEADLRIGAPSSYSDSGEEIYIYGAQLEAGSYATSYIPNYGTAGGMTRAQDQAEFDQDVASGAWTIYMDVENLTIDSGGYTGNFFFKSLVSPSDSALFFNQNCFGWPNTSSGISYSCGKLGVAGTEFTGKWAVTYDGVNTIKIYVDGSLESTVTDVDPNRASGISSGQLQYNGDHKPRKIINDLKIYNKELSQSEAEALTA